MFIQTEQTPNPGTLKFLPGEPVMVDGVAEFTDAAEAERLSPLAARVFRVDGVTGVYLGGDFISVTKAAGEEWHNVYEAQQRLDNARTVEVLGRVVDGN